MIDIRELRIQKGLTQEQLAKSIGVERSVIAKIETDKNYNASVETAKGLGKVLEFEWSELFEY